MTSLGSSQKRQGFFITNSKADASLFTQKNDKGIIVVLVYVDDILITGSNTVYITELITLLSSKFVMKDLGSLSYFLGIEVLTTDKGILLSQTKYATDLLVKARMLDCRPSPSPCSTKPTVLEPDIPFSDQHSYRAIVGSLQYLTLTRPELSFAVNLACQHMLNPK